MSRAPARLLRGVARILFRALGLERRPGRAAGVPEDPETLLREEDRRFRDMLDDAEVPDKPFHSLGETPLHLYRLGLAFSALRLGPRDEVLDFGAGTCWTSALLVRMGIRTAALDVSPAALEIGRRVLEAVPRPSAAPGPELRTYDGRRFPFDDGRFDAILCYDSFHHVPNHDEILDEMHRVLKPDGRVVFCEPVFEHEESGTSRIERQRYGVLERAVDPARLEAVALEAGFAALVRKPYPMLPDEVVAGSSLWSHLAHGVEQGAWSYLDRIAVFFLKKSLREPLDSNHPGTLRAELEPVEERLRCTAGERLSLRLRVVNRGDTLWLTDEHPRGGFVTLGGQLLDADGHLLERDWLRTPLPRPLSPGATADMEVTLTAPERAGRYGVKFDPVDENVCWFEERGSEPVVVSLEVGPPERGPRRPRA